MYKELFFRKVPLIFAAVFIVAIIAAVILDLFSFEVSYYKTSYKIDGTKYIATIINTLGGKNNNANLTINSSKVYESLKGKKFLQISDLHNKSYGKNNSSLIKAIDEINPDFIFLTGDMVSATDESFEGFFSLVEGISPKYKCFYITGNHEQALSFKSISTIYQKLNDCKVSIIEDDICEIMPYVNLYGLNYELEYYKYTDLFDVPNMQDHLGEVYSDYFNILITHDPNAFETYRFRLTAKNGQNILASEGYSQLSGCMNGISSVKENAPDAEIEEEA